MVKDIQHFIDACDSCQRDKAVRSKPVGKLRPLQTPGRRWESVCMDFITDLSVTSKGHDALWVVVDRLSKMVHIVPCKKMVTAPQVAEMYKDRISCIMVSPQTWYLIEM